MIGQNPKAEVAPSSISGIRDKENHFLKRDVAVNGWDESRGKLRVKNQNRDLWDSS